MKQKFGIMLITFILLIGGTSEVFADDGVGGGTNIGGGITSPFAPCNGGMYCWNTAPYPSGNRIQAIRVSIVDAMGNRWPGTKSIDFFKHDDAANQTIFRELAARKNTNYYKAMYTKNEIVKLYLNSTLASTSGDYTKRSNIVKLEGNAFPNYNGANVNVLKPYFLRVASKKDNMLENFFIPTFLSPLGFDYYKEREKLKTNPKHFENIAILIEPVVFFRLTSNRGGSLSWTLEYAGTVTEVAHMMSSPKAKDADYTGSDRFFDLIRPGKTYRGLHFNNPTAFDKDFPLAIYATKSKGGLTGIQHWIEPTLKYSNFASEILTSNGVAAGHVWFDELFCPAPDKITNDDLPLCCMDLINGNRVNNSNYQKCCKELYETGNLKYNHLPACCHVLPSTDPLFRSKCYTPPPPENSCRWKLDISCPDNCFNKTKGSVKDMDDWDCIFQSRQANRSNIRTHYYEWSNRYCDYYCREEVNYQLPRSGFNVQAGHHFTVGTESSNSWAPIKFEGMSECRTTSDIKKIKYEQFQRDYDYVDRRLPGLWDEYKKQEVLDLSRNAAVRSGSKNCDYYCDYNVHGITCCRDADRDWDDCKYGSPHTCVGGRGADGKWDPCKDTRDTCRGGWGPWYCVIDDDPYDHGYTMTPPPRSRGDYGPYQERTWCTTNGSGNEQTRPSSGTPSARSAYNSAINQRDRYLADLKLCNDWQRNYNHFRPRLFLDFEEDIYGIYNMELATTIRNNVYNDYYVGNSYRRGSYLRQARTTSHVCNGYKRCVAREINYPTNENVRQYYYRTINYRLPSGIYQYITKPAGYSTSTIPVGQYVNLGYSNLPIHYSRLPGSYEISLEYKTFGNSHKFNRYVFDGVSFTGNYLDSVRCNTLYDCDYRVTNDFLEDYTKNREKFEKLNVVFRPISLSNPFPGKKGIGRTPGSNWRWNVSKITHNRGLREPERIFFDTEPMYQITLTPQLIRSIRTYNKNQDGGYGNFKLTCGRGTGRECKSSFIRDTYRSYFSGCGISSSWNACS